MLRVVSVNWRKKIMARIKLAMDELYNALETKEGIDLSVNCPTCSEKFSIADPLEFGKAYEFRCADCKTTFVIVIPMIQVIPGTLEVLKTHERHRTKGYKNPIATRAVPVTA